MAFVCPDCTERSLEIALTIELPSDGTHNETCLQLVECEQCGFQGIAVYGESRRGALDSECWSHDGYRLGKESLESFMETMKQCPSPSNCRCECGFHRALSSARTRDTFDIHKVDGMVIDGYFDMIYVSAAAE
jgi:hypothetical protein